MRGKLLTFVAYGSVIGGWLYMSVLRGGHYLENVVFFAPLAAILVLVQRMQQTERRRVSREIDSAGGLDNWRKLHLG
jgi:hypothetical protein